MSLIPATACMKGDLPLTLRVISHGLMLTPRRTGLRSRCTIEGSIRRIMPVAAGRRLTSPSRWPLAAAFSRMGAGGSVERPGRHLGIDVKARLAIHIARGQGFVLPAAQVARSLAAKRGVQAVRINCAHDDADAWGRMIGHLRAAEAATDRDLKVFMDLAGPKIRTGDIRLPDHGKKTHRGDLIAILTEPS